MPSPETLSETPLLDTKTSAQLDHNAILELLPEAVAAEDQEVLREWADENRADFQEANKALREIPERPREAVTDATVAEAGLRSAHIMSQLGNVADNWRNPKS